MYSGEYDACDVTLSSISTPGKLENMPDHGGNRTYDLWNTSPMLCQLSYAVWSVRVCDISEQKATVEQLAEHWASIPKVVGSIPTVVRHIFKLARCGYTAQSNITSIMMTHKFPLTSLLSHVYVKQVFLEKFTLGIILSRVYGKQVFLDKFCGLFVQNIYLTQRLPFVCQNHRNISWTLVRSFPWRPYTRTNLPCPKARIISFGTI